MRSPMNQRGFTLVEILIVVIILGILAAIVMANVGTSAEETRRNTFISTLKTFVRLESGFRAESGEYLADAASGVCPTGFDRFINPDEWAGLTPIGGQWDSLRDADGVISAIGVHFNGSGTTQDDAYMARVDALFDDGNLATGGFRKLNNARFYYVIAE